MAQEFLKYLKEQCESEREEARRWRQIDKEEFQRQCEKDKQDREKDKQEREKDKQEFLELKAQVLMQGSPQRSTHQPTDTAAHDDPYTPTGRQPHGSDATLTDPSEVSGVGRSL